jgi:response regulator of citrate/malate metabolism
MVKTRSETRNLAKQSTPSIGVSNTPVQPSKIVKRTEHKETNVQFLPIAPKSGVTTANESIAESYSPPPADYSDSNTRQIITAEQIKSFIGCIVNKNMSVRIAANKVNIGYSAGYIYYNLYKNDPEKKIPLPRDTTMEGRGERTKMSIGFIVNDGGMAPLEQNEPVEQKEPDSIMPIQSHRCGYISRKYSQDQINKLIGYIVDDDMSIQDAANLVNVSRDIGRKYYYQYMEDPEHKIPIVKSKSGNGKPCTQDQINKLISYIVDGNNSIPVAAKMANISVGSGRKYYQLYMDDPQHRIPIQTRKVCSGNGFTQEQINELIHYIVHDKMTLKAASLKANMSKGTAGKYYRQYLKNPHLKDRNDNKTGGSGYVLTQEKVKQVIKYIVDDNLSIDVAAGKAKISPGAARKYCRIYMEDPNHKIPILNESYRADRETTQDQIRDLIAYIVKDEMSIETAAAKAGMSGTAGRRYYREYCNDPNHAIPLPGITSAQAHCTQDQIRELIGYIVEDQMTMKAASTKAGMSEVTGRKYYRQYLNDPNKAIPVPGRTKKSLDGFTA